MSSTLDTCIDLRDVPHHARHALVFDRFDALSASETLELVNDHDPAPLRHQLEARSAGRFAWSALEAGPAVWRIRIAKAGAVALPVAADSCCSGGACCG